MAQPSLYLYDCITSRQELKNDSLFIFRGTSAGSSSRSTAGIGTAERTFLTPKNTQTNLTANIPSLDEFDAEIEIYRVS